ncbi:MAG: reductive dehalogenase [Dehalogenimonas sp.]
MAKFHSIMSRRDFMKILGLSAAGIGGASLVAPAFHDLDEMLASDRASWKRPWYVKQRELYNPTSDVDWDIMKRFDRCNEGHQPRQEARYNGTKRVQDSKTITQPDNLARDLAENRPGKGHKWVALRNAFDQSQPRKYSIEFAGPKGLSLKTPAQMGVPKWTGTPEENSRLLRAASRYLGAGMVGYQDLDDKWRNKLLISYNTTGVKDFKWADLSLPYPPPDSERYKYVYEDVDQGYEVTHTNSEGGKAGKGVIPTKQMYLVCFAWPDSLSNNLTTLSTVSNLNVGKSVYGAPALAGIWAFLYGLGYHSCGGTGDQERPEIHGATTGLTGIAEQARQNNWVLVPEWGNHMSSNSIFTDFPLAPTTPIDAGMFRFCRSCKKCAEACPVGCISFENEPTYDITQPNYNGVAQIEHNPGPKHFWTAMGACKLFYDEVGWNCGVCNAACTFSVGHSSMIHAVIKSSIATTGTFNSFLFNMSKSFGYGAMENKEDWWNLSLPIYGIDSTSSATDKIW